MAFFDLGCRLQNHEGSQFQCVKCPIAISDTEGVTLPLPVLMPFPQEVPWSTVWGHWRKKVGRALPTAALSCLPWLEPQAPLDPLRKPPWLNIMTVICN